MTVHRYENRWDVWIDYQLSGDPDPNPVLQTDMAAVQVSRVIGGRSIPSATFVRETEARLGSQSRATSIHQDLDVRSYWDIATATSSPLVTIVRYDYGTPTPVPRIVHRGLLVGTNLVVGPKGEETIYTSRFDHWCMSQAGAPIYNTQWVDHHLLPTNVSVWTDFGTTIEVSLDLIFNPIVDGRPRQNRYMQTDPASPDPADPIELPMPFDVDGVPTTFVTGPPAEVDWWDLASIVHYLLQTYNDQRYVTNPTYDELKAQLGTDKTLVRNFKLRRGAYLPQVLDELLMPLGYCWMYIYGTAVTDPVALYFWQRNTPPPAGTATAVPLQRFGEVVDLTHPTDWTEAESYNIKYDAFSRSAPKVIGTGGLKEYEYTLELVPAWDPKHDDVPLPDLVEGSDAMVADPSLKRVYRDWVLNEGGDYAAYSEHANRVGGVYENGLKDAYPFPFDGAEFLARRRKLKKMLSVPMLDPKQSPFGVVAGVAVEVWEPISQTWGKPAELDLGSPQILDDECGIRFGQSSENLGHLHGMFKPLATDPDESMRVRVTATIESDQRIVQEADAGVISLIPGEKVQLLDVGNKYRWSKVDASSDFFGDPNFDSREYDSSIDLQGLANRVLESWNASTVSGQIVIIGTGNIGEYLGWEISGFQNRNVVITATHSLFPKQINPTVVAVNYDVVGNRTTLSLEVLRHDLRRY